MGHQDKDVESLQESGRRRGSCLDAFLIMSILFLFVAVTAVAAGGVMVMMELRAKLESARQIPAFEKLTGGTPSPVYKMQNFAYLQATSSELMNTTMSWDLINHGPGTSVGSNFHFDPKQHSLKPHQVGSYFMYIELNLTCTFRCRPGLLTVRVGDKLTCEVELPANSATVSKKCWTVSQMDGQSLLTQMTVPKGGLENWKLESSGSGLGMFLVD